MIFRCSVFMFVSRQFGLRYSAKRLSEIFLYQNLTNRAPKRQAGKLFSRPIATRPMVTSSRHRSTSGHQLRHAAAPRRPLKCHFLGVAKYYLSPLERLEKRGRGTRKENINKCQPRAHSRQLTNRDRIGWPTYFALQAKIH